MEMSRKEPWVSRYSPTANDYKSMSFKRSNWKFDDAFYKFYIFTRLFKISRNRFIYLKISENREMKKTSAVLFCLKAELKLGQEAIINNCSIYCK